jgi:hypothetical protein
MRPRVVACVAVASMVVGLVAAPGAVAKPKSCKPGTVQVKVRGRPACLPKRVVLPPPAATAPALAQVRGAVAMTQLGFKTRSGKRAAPLAKKLRRSWPKARSRMLKAMSLTLAKATTGLHTPAATAAADADPCAMLDLVTNGQTVDVEGTPTTFGGSQNVGGVGVSLGVTSGGMEIGMQTTVKGDTYSFKYESSLSECAKHTIPPCPDADGNLNASGTKGKVGFSSTVTRGGKVISKRSYAKSVSVETKGKVADDAKLDYVDVKYSETTTVISDGLRYTSYGNRLTRINMRSGSYDPGESVSFGNASQAGESINTAGTEADAQDFAAFVNKTMSNYRAREAAWQKAGACATLKLDPVKDTIKVKPGATGSFSAQVLAVNGGGVAAGARWTLSAQKNGTFTPTSTNDRTPSFSYTVDAHPTTQKLIVTVHATSTAGVAEETWSQDIEGLQTITGTFTGHATDLGVVYDWTGTATFTKTDTGTDVPGPGGVFQLTSGQATVTVSGSLIGSGCDQTGTSTIGLFPQSPWTVTGTESPFSYQVIAPFMPDVPKATNMNCSDSNQNGTDAGLGSMPVPALQSGDIAGGANPNGLVQTTTDLYSYSGGASAHDGGESQNWTWSMTGQP